MKTDYQKQAEDFLTATDTTCRIAYDHYGKHFADDKEERDIYQILLRRNRKNMLVKFGQSIVGTQSDEEPTPYDVLTCLTKSDPDNFENFCGEFGYDTDSRKAYATWQAVCKEWHDVKRVFGDVIEQLQEIQ